MLRLLKSLFTRYALETWAVIGVAYIVVLLAADAYSAHYYVSNDTANLNAQCEEFSVFPLADLIQIKPGQQWRVSEYTTCIVREGNRAVGCLEPHDDSGTRTFYVSNADLTSTSCGWADEEESTGPWWAWIAVLPILGFYFLGFIGVVADFVLVARTTRGVFRRLVGQRTTFK